MAEEKLSKEELKEYWSTDSGLLDDFDFTITDAKFATDMQYNDGQTLLMIWEGTTDDPDNPEQRIMFPCGNGWLSPDGGKTAVHEGGRKRFIGTSMYGRVVNRCMNELDMLDVFAQRGLPPTNAEVWVGLKFHMKREKIEFGSALEPRERLMPVAFLGVVGAEEESKAKSAKKAEKTEKATEQSAKEDAKRKALRIKLTALAKKCETFEDFVTQAMEIEGVQDDEELLAQVIDENGIYAQAH